MYIPLAMIQMGSSTDKLVHFVLQKMENHSYILSWNIVDKNKNTSRTKRLVSLGIGRTSTCHVVSKIIEQKHTHLLKKINTNERIYLKCEKSFYT